MADYSALLRTGVALASDLTRSLQATVTIAAWNGQDLRGKNTHATAVPYAALVEMTRKQKYTSTGKLVMTLAVITILDPVADTMATGRMNPIDPRDIVTLPDGQTQPIVDIKSFVDAGLNRPFYNEITLGETMK